MKLSNGYNRALADASVFVLFIGVSVGAALAQDGVVQIEAVTVEGAGERADGPVRGFVAKRSATGTKTDAALVETPQSVSVVTQDQIRATGAQNPSEALRYTAGVQAERFGGDPRFDWIKIRNFDVPEYLDGLQLPKGIYAWPRYETFAVERLEVLKGPASVLYGQTPPGGLVNFVSKKPLDTAQNEVRVQAGNYGRLQAAFDLTGPVDPEKKISYRLVGLGRMSDTVVDYVNDDRAFIAPSLTFRPNEATTFTVLAHYLKDSSKSLQFLPSQGTLFPNPNGRIPRSLFLGEPGYDRFDRREWAFGYQFEHKVNADLTLRQNFRYTVVDADLPVIRGFGFPSVGGVPTTYNNVTRRVVRFDDRVDALTIDNQAQWNVATGPVRHTFLAGFDYRRFTTDFTTRNGVGPSLDVYNPVYGQPIAAPPLTISNAQRLGQAGLYLQDQMKFGRFTLLLSGRYDNVSNDNLNRLTNVQSSQKNDKFTYRAGLIYNFDNGLAPYVSYSTSFYPSVGVSAAGFGPTYGQTAAGSPFVPTEGRQIEGGIKYQPPGTDHLFTASVFQINQKNVLVADTANPGFQSQIGRVRANGLELEAKVNLMAGLDMIGSYTYFDSEITNANAALIGKELTVAPRHQAAGFLQYTIQDGALRGLGVTAGVRYFGPHWGDQPNTLRVPSYTLVDAGIKYDLGAATPKLKGAEFAVTASNLFDKVYVSTCGDVNTCYYGAARTVLATLSYRW